MLKKMAEAVENAAAQVEAWKEAVKEKYPNVASKLKFKSKDQGKNICAEVDGQDRCYGVFDVQKGKGEVLGESAPHKADLSVLLNYLTPEISNNITFEMLEEALNMAKIHVSQLNGKDIPGIKDDVFTIKNESPVIDALVTLLGIPRDGTAYKIRTGFMAYDAKNKILFFSKNKYDLPDYLGKRPGKVKEDLDLGEAVDNKIVDLDDEDKMSVADEIKSFVNKEVEVRFEQLDGKFGVYFASVSFHGKILKITDKGYFILEYNQFGMNDRTAAGGPGDKIRAYKSGFQIKDIKEIDDHHGYPRIVMKKD